MRIAIAILLISWACILFFLLGCAIWDSNRIEKEILKRKRP